MADLKVRLEGVEQLRARLALFPPKLRRNIMRGGIRAAVAVYRKGVQRRVPVQSGQLRKSATVSTRVFPDGRVQGKVTVGGRKAFYANIVEHGAKPHTIRAVRAKALDIGPGRFVTEVQHPGFRGRAFVKTTEAVDQPAASRAFAAYVAARVNKELGL